MEVFTYGGDLYDITYLATDKGENERLMKYYGFIIYELYFIPWAYSGPGCGGELYNYGGMFTSPGYPEIDRNSTDCTWTINVPMNLNVALQFEGIFITLIIHNCYQNNIIIINLNLILCSLRYGNEIM